MSNSVSTYCTFSVKFVVFVDLLPWCDDPLIPPKSHSPYNCLMWSLISLFTTTYLIPLVWLEMVHLNAWNLSVRQFHIFIMLKVSKQLHLALRQIQWHGIKTTAFWIVTTYSLVGMHTCFGVTHFFHFQGKRYWLPHENLNLITRHLAHSLITQFQKRYSVFLEVTNKLQVLFTSVLT